MVSTGMLTLPIDVWSAAHADMARAMPMKRHLVRGLIMFAPCPLRTDAEREWRTEKRNRYFGGSPRRRAFRLVPAHPRADTGLVRRVVVCLVALACGCLSPAQTECG